LGSNNISKESKSKNSVDEGIFKIKLKLSYLIIKNIYSSAFEYSSDKISPLQMAYIYKYFNNKL